MKRRFSSVSMVVGIVLTMTSQSCSRDTTLTSDNVGPERGLRRLTRREYNNAVRDLLGDDSKPADNFGLEVYANGFDSGSKALVVRGPEVFAYRAAAEALAARAVMNLAQLIGTCDPVAGESVCVESFLEGFAMQAYRRPLRFSEAERLRAVYAAGSAAGGFKGGIQLMVEAVLQSPAFVYREEIGEPDSLLPPGAVRLDPYEAASALSFLFTGGPPDAILLQAAADHRLETPGDRRREATRLLTLPAARETFGAFLHQWLGTDRVATLAKNTSAYPAFDSQLAASMSRELDGYFAKVAAGSGSLRELFTSTDAVVDGRLASIYGLPAVGQGFAAVKLDPSTRRGVLTRPGYLAAHSDFDSSGPIPRGVFLLGELLCAPPPPPPPDIPLPPPRSEAVQRHLTTRQRFDIHVGSPACQSCHSRIDAIGFGFEEFDGMGAYRTMENGSPIDSSGSIVGTTIDGPFVGVSALSERLASSPEVLSCYVRHAYRFAYGAGETGDSDGLLLTLGQGMTSDSRLTDAFVAIAAHPSFTVRQGKENKKP